MMDGYEVSLLQGIRSSLEEIVQLLKEERIANGRLPTATQKKDPAGESSG